MWLEVNGRIFRDGGGSVEQFVSGVIFWGGGEGGGRGFPKGQFSLLALFQGVVLLALVFLGVVF